MNAADDVVVDGNYAYVTSRQSDSVTVIDISTPTVPLIVATLFDNGGTLRLNGASGIVKDGNYLYIASQISDAMQVIDVSTPTAPIAA